MITKVHVLRRSPDAPSDADAGYVPVAGGAPVKSGGAVNIITHLFCIKNGAERVPILKAQAGDIVMLAGFEVRI